MYIDLDVLEFLLTDKGRVHLERSVGDSGYKPQTVVGVATFLLDNLGNYDLLTAKQQTTFDRFIAPLIFKVPCQGPRGNTSCRGDGEIDPPSLLSAYSTGKFQCKMCRKTDKYAKDTPA